MGNRSGRGCSHDAGGRASGPAVRRPDRRRLGHGHGCCPRWSPAVQGQPVRRPRSGSGLPPPSPPGLPRCPPGSGRHLACGRRAPASGPGRPHRLRRKRCRRRGRASTGATSAKRSSSPASGLHRQTVGVCQAGAGRSGAAPGGGEHQRSEHPDPGHGGTAGLSLLDRVQAVPAGRGTNRLCQHQCPGAHRSVALPSSQWSASMT